MDPDILQICLEAGHEGLDIEVCAREFVSAGKTNISEMGKFVGAGMK